MEERGRIQVNPETDFLLGVDPQMTFMPGGGLPVTDGDAIIPPAKMVLLLFPLWRRGATQDCHHFGHISLASSYMGLVPFTELTEKMVSSWAAGNHRIAPHARFTLAQLKEYLGIVKSQVLWPDHALEGTTEAYFHPAFPVWWFEFVLVKGRDPACDCYSGARDNRGRSTGLTEHLRRRDVRRVFIWGLAEDYCVGATALHLAEDGFEVYVIADATRPVGAPEGSVERMHKAFRENGVCLIQSTDLFVA